MPYSQDYQVFLKKLKEAREEAGLTQLQVANTLGKNQSFISKCESGERRVDVLELKVFAELYGKSLDYFVGNSPD
jgi:transcriptional regulator with XRE-family HTH domain